jgi:hypothetical protein
MANHVCSTPNNRHYSAALFHGSASPCQQIAHRTIVPISASGGADASIIQRLSDGAVGGSTSSLYLPHDGQDVCGEGVGGLPVCCHALCLRIPEVGAVS